MRLLQFRRKNRHSENKTNMTNNMKQLITAIAFAAIAHCGTASFAADTERRAIPIKTGESSDLKAANKAAADFQKRLKSEPDLAKKVTDAVQSKDDAALARIVQPEKGMNVQGVIESKTSKLGAKMKPTIRICFVVRGVRVCISIGRE